jgi:hypothetical protein
MAGGAESAPSADHFVQRTLVNESVRHHFLRVHDRHQLHRRTVRKQFFRVRTSQQMSLRVPTRSFEEKTPNVTSIFRFLFYVLVIQVVQKLKVKSYLVNCNCVLTRIVLHHTSHKCLSHYYIIQNV